MQGQQNMKMIRIYVYIHTLMNAEMGIGVDVVVARGHLVHRQVVGWRERRATLGLVMLETKQTQIRSHFGVASINSNNCVNL